MASSLKKSNVKKKTERAVKMAEQKRMEEEKVKQQAELQKQRNKDNFNVMIDSMMGVYGLFLSVLSLLFFNIGILFSSIGSILGFIGIRRTKAKKDKMFYLSVAGFIIGIVSSAIWLVYVGYILLHS